MPSRSVSRSTLRPVAVASALLVVLSSLMGAPAIARDPDPVVPGASAQITARSERDRGQGAGKLDSAMAAVAAAATRPDHVLEVARSRGIRAVGGRIQAVITVAGGRAAELNAAIRSAGGETTSTAGNGRLIQALVPAGALRAIAQRPGVIGVAKPATPFLEAGSYTTQGLAAMQGGAWQDAGLDGTGVKVGVIDMGFLGYQGLVGSDLPPAARLTVKNFVDGETDAQVNGTTEHGTACAEIVHDIAPGAHLYLVKVGTQIDLEQAANYLQAQGVDIITSSLGWYNVTPGDGTGFFEDLVKAKRNAGITWFTAAGNDRQAHWGGSFADFGDGSHRFASGQNVNWFGVPDGITYVEAGYPVCVFLRWSDWAPPVTPDLDLYILEWVDSSQQWVDVPAGASENDQSTGWPFPTEEVCITSEGAYYGFAVTRYSGGGTHMEIFAPKVDRLAIFREERSLANLADANSAVTVAALDSGAPYAQETYSSEGPTNGAGGVPSGGKIKPDIAGFANVSTAAYAPYLPYTFNGTSAATPHVAGAAALVLDAGPTYSPTQLEAFLTGRAIDMGGPGLDNAFGYGRLHLGAAPLPTDIQALSSAGSSGTPFVGDHWNVTTTLRNNGPNAATGVTLKQTVPSWATYLSGPAGCTLAGATVYGGKTRGGSVTCNIGSLASGASRSRTFTFGPLQSGSLSSVGTVSLFGTDTTANNSRTATASAAYRSGQTSRCTRLGGIGHDTLNGTGGIDVVCSFGGNDIISGLGGNDVMNGGPGVDQASVATALAAVTATLATGTSACTTGTTCGVGSDKLVGIEDLAGGAYNDRLTGNTAVNRLYGNSGNDSLYGGDGNDRLFGGAGNDRLFGQAGVDYFDGGTGTADSSDWVEGETKINVP